MAISKILCMNDSGGSFKGKHLKRTIDYIMATEKTNNKRFTAGVNCQVDDAFAQMMATKQMFDKTDKRQGYHIVLSFKEGEIDAATAFELAGRFVNEYLENEYEAVYAVHDNTEHVHAHIVYNSVSFLTGQKYHYKKGDWEREIQPITNRLCREYGLSEIDIDFEVRDRTDYSEWSYSRDGEFVWSDMIKRDINACIVQSATFESFITMLEDKGYEVKQGKYLAVKPQGMKRFRRCKTFGEDYTEEAIRNRIITENISTYKKENEAVTFRPRLVRCYVKRYKRAKLGRLQKNYFFRLYKTKRLMKRPYSQAWKYKDGIRKMKELQQHYLFLRKYKINSTPELAVIVEELKQKRREVSKEKSRIYREKAGFDLMFQLIEKMDELKECEQSYQAGDEYFKESHEEWMNHLQELMEQGYSYSEACALRDYYYDKSSQVSRIEKAAIKELNIAKKLYKNTVNEGKVRTDITEVKEQQIEQTKEPEHNKIHRKEK